MLVTKMSANQDNNRLKKSISISLFLLCLSLLSQTSNAQDMPDQCVQLPQRTQVCPNLLYKRAPLSINELNIVEGDIVCICMTDFASIRLEATSEQGKIDQLIEMGRISAALKMSESDLLTLLRK